ncbi:MAG: hypothetical protein K8R79_06145 [Calditrichales bacterium]|nr:hypothetical protein [Calditrichales bacterium]
MADESIDYNNGIKNNNQIVNTLSSHLFWDVDISDIDEKKHSKYIITKVLKYGLYSDWKTIVKFYSLNMIIDLAVKMRGLDKKTAAFLSIISDVPKNKFTCYITEQSTPKHWNF